MINTKEQSFLDTAESILVDKKEPVDLYELFDMVVEIQGASTIDIVEKLNAFYADITTSARFVYMGSNTWDLKRHQKIELWEKDGSYFNEYSEVEDEMMDQRIADQNKREADHQAMLERREQALAEKAEKAAKAPEEAPKEVPVIDDTPVLNTEDVIEAAEEKVQEVIAEDKKEEKVETKEKSKDDTEDTDEEYDGFDEEEYNEYMDEFEDKYDKK